MALAPSLAFLAPAVVVASAGAGLASPGLVAVVARSVSPPRADAAQATVNAGTGPGPGGGGRAGPGDAGLARCLRPERGCDRARRLRRAAARPGERCARRAGLPARPDGSRCVAARAAGPGGRRDPAGRRLGRHVDLRSDAARGHRRQRHGDRAGLDRPGRRGYGHGAHRRPARVAVPAARLAAHVRGGGGLDGRPRPDGCTAAPARRRVRGFRLGLRGGELRPHRVGRPRASRARRGRHLGAVRRARAGPGRRRLPRRPGRRRARDVDGLPARCARGARRGGVRMARRAGRRTHGRAGPSTKRAHQRMCPSLSCDRPRGRRTSWGYLGSARSSLSRPSANGTTSQIVPDTSS